MRSDAQPSSKPVRLQELLLQHSHTWNWKYSSPGNPCCWKHTAETCKQQEVYGDLQPPQMRRDVHRDREILNTKAMGKFCSSAVINTQSHLQETLLKHW